MSMFSTTADSDIGFTGFPLSLLAENDDALAVDVSINDVMEINNTSWPRSGIYDDVSDIIVNRSNDSILQHPYVPPHGTLATVAIATVATLLAALTSGGNLLVVLSFRVDAQLQRVSNYFLLSLAIADFAIGAISMPLYTAYLLLNYWPFGPIVCDAWLSLDYTVSNASVANLMLISFDRFMCVTRPLTYRVHRTPCRAVVMIVLAWTISALLWTPWIVGWPFIEGVRTVPDDRCEIQFLSSNPYFTVFTAAVAFYLPVLLMCFLYGQIYRETERRRKGLARLQAHRQSQSTFSTSAYSVGNVVVGNDESSDGDISLAYGRTGGGRVPPQNGSNCVTPPPYSEELRQLYETALRRQRLSGRPFPATLSLDSTDIEDDSDSASHGAASAAAVSGTLASRCVSRFWCLTCRRRRLRRRWNRLVRWLNTAVFRRRTADDRQESVSGKTTVDRPPNVTAGQWSSGECDSSYSFSDLHVQAAVGCSTPESESGKYRIPFHYPVSGCGSCVDGTGSTGSSISSANLRQQSSIRSVTTTAGSSKRTFALTSSPSSSAMAAWDPSDVVLNDVNGKEVKSDDATFKQSCSNGSAQVEAQEGSKVNNDSKLSAIASSSAPTRTTSDKQSKPFFGGLSILSRSPPQKSQGDDSASSSESFSTVGSLMMAKATSSLTAAAATAVCRHRDRATGSFRRSNRGPLQSRAIVAISEEVELQLRHHQKHCKRPSVDAAVAKAKCVQIEPDLESTTSRATAATVTTTSEEASVDQPLNDEQTCATVAPRAELLSSLVGKQDNDSGMYQQQQQQSPTFHKIDDVRAPVSSSSVPGENSRNDDDDDNESAIPEADDDDTELAATSSSVRFSQPPSSPSSHPCPQQAIDNELDPSAASGTAAASAINVEGGGGDDVDSRSTATGSSLTRTVGGNRGFSIGRRFTETTEALVAGMQARIASRVTERARELRARQRRRERRQEQKAAKTLSAILLTFVITWTPYNVFVVITAFCNDCISDQWFAFGYWLCYINSTINPVLYALCNAAFRRTYWRIVTCRWARRRRSATAAAGVQHCHDAAQHQQHLSQQHNHHHQQQQQQQHLLRQTRRLYQSRGQQHF